ncbi:hypothetical protein N7535_009029 [Penicillium sp. DV-2018c]|nr:hypothetical protein N7461_003078 [Penicillium sp. DV-2018c]KAJ5560832.1 hypothetical protein N7535_009029 [Penicillium sp. DV-2018c]
MGTFMNSGGNSNTTSSTATPGATSSLFGNTSTTPKPAGGLFGASTTPAAGTTQQSQTTGSNMFGGQQQSGGGLFGSSTTPATKPAGTSNLFGGSTAGAGTSTTQGTTGGGLGGSTLFGGTSTAQTQAKPAFGGLGGSSTGGGLFGGGQNTTQQQQQQQPQKPSLGIFGQSAAAPSTQPTLQQSTTTSTVIPGVKVDVSNLLPTTKFESCADEIRSQIEAIDKHILNQMKMCHEVGDLLPTIEQQGATIPNDVEFVQSKLETIQHALENDASDIDGLRSLVTRDAAEAQVAFRAIDTLKLPLQYQTTARGGWWSVQDQPIPERSMRSSRKNTLALPDGVEGDDSSATDINGVPVNLVDYFSHRTKEMHAVLGKFTSNLKEIEDHLHGVEANLNRQISDFVSSKSRDAAPGAPRSTKADLAAVLTDVETGIMGVATRLSNVSEQVQDMSS